MGREQCDIRRRLSPAHSDSDRALFHRSDISSGPSLQGWIQVSTTVTQRPARQSEHDMLHVSLMADKAPAICMPLSCPCMYEYSPHLPLFATPSRQVDQASSRTASEETPKALLLALLHSTARNSIAACHCETAPARRRVPEIVAAALGRSCSSQSSTRLADPTEEAPSANCPPLAARTASHVGSSTARLQRDCCAMPGCHHLVAGELAILSLPCTGPPPSLCGQSATQG